jgi:hypothetical protein
MRGFRRVGGVLVGVQLLLLMIQCQPFVSSGGAYVAVVTQDSKVVCWRINDRAECEKPPKSDVGGAVRWG